MKTESMKPVSLELVESYHAELRETVKVRHYGEWLTGVVVGHRTKGNFTVEINNSDDIVCKRASELQPYEGCSELQLFFNFVCINLGLGTLNLPWTFAGSSIVPSLIILLLTMCQHFWACCAMIDATDRFGYDNLGAFIKIHFEDYPKTAMILQKATTFFVNVTTMMILIGYYMVVEHVLKELIPKVPSHYWYLGAPVIFSALVFLPAHTLSWTSFAALSLNIYLIGLFSAELHQMKELPKIKILGYGRGWISFIGIMGMALAIQPYVPSLYMEAKYRKAKRVKTIMGLALATVYVIFCVVGTLGYLAYGPAVKDDVLTSMSKNIPNNIGKVGMSATVAFSAPLLMMVVFSSAEDMLSETQKVYMPFVKSALMIIPAALAFACSIAGFGLSRVNCLSGAMCIFWFVAIVPYILSLHPRSSYWGIFEGFLAFAGLITAVLSAIFDDNYVDDL